MHFVFFGNMGFIDCHSWPLFGMIFVQKSYANPKVS